MNQSEKTKLGLETIHEFFNNFGDDIYSQLLIDVLLKELFENEKLLISSESEQERNKTDHSVPSK